VRRLAIWQRKQAGVAIQLAGAAAMAAAANVTPLARA
jgi:hypothetical protein